MPEKQLVTLCKFEQFVGFAKLFPEKPFSFLPLRNTIPDFGMVYFTGEKTKAKELTDWFRISFRQKIFPSDITSYAEILWEIISTDANFDIAHIYSEWAKRESGDILNWEFLTPILRIRRDNDL